MENVSATAPLVTADGTPLKVSLQRALRRRRIQAGLLVLPLLIFILTFFVVPIGIMLTRSVDNPEINTILPRTVIALQAWDDTTGELPSEEVFKTIAEEFVAGSQPGNRVINKVGKRLNYEVPGMSSLFRTSARKIKQMKTGPYREKLTSINIVGKRWADVATWRLIKRESDPVTASYFLSALDSKFDAKGDVVAQPEERRIYKFLFLRTFFCSAIRLPICSQHCRCAMRR